MSQEQEMGVPASPSGAREPNPQAVSALQASPPNAAQVHTLLRQLANAPGESACLTGTAMIPLHKETVKVIADLLTEPRYPPICGYPLPGWQLDFVKFDEPNDGQPSGWLVKLRREKPSWNENRLEHCVMARSDVGPLDAWEEAIRIARRCDERAAQVDTDRNGEDAKQASCASSGSAVGNADAPKPPSEPSGEPSNTQQDTGETR